MTLEGFIGYIASVSTVIGLIPQTIKSFKVKSTIDVSMVMLINFLVCSVSWAIYGKLTNTCFVLWSNIFSTMVAITSIIQKKYYDKRGH
ncbi:MAG: hypothetical protein LBF70_01630 [Holosporales bacterium]|nr:hypothetical protein [Holosporales bacterium]